MINPFVDYLNTLNNASSNNENALAESQVLNEYYEKVMVERNIGTKLTEMVTEQNPQTIILTGHAGDGKTSLLIQVLKSLGLLEPKKALKKYDFVKNSHNRGIFYVKDMSELNSDEQLNLLSSALSAPKEGKSAILVSNTGPLINTFEKLFTNQPEVDAIDVEMTLLESLDQNDEKKIKLGEYSFTVINIARIDNVGIIKQILEKILAADLWEGNCSSCVNQAVCPIYNNYKNLTNNRHKNRVIEFIQNYYRWLYENDSRLTIRQILSHLSFAITGNLNCNQVNKLSVNRDALFNYNFSNLFFGFKGIKEIPDAKQIRAIRELNKLNLDSICISQDYKLFVQNDFSDFAEEQQNLLELTYKKYIKRSVDSDIGSTASMNSIQLRRSFRRFFFFFSNIDSERFNLLIQDLYSPVFPMFLEYRNLEYNNLQKRRLSNLIFEGLYRLLVGVPPRNEKKLFLTLKRNNENIQSVQLIQGEVDLSHLKLEQKKVKGLVDDDFRNYQMYLGFTNMKEEFEVTLPLLEYFDRLAQGSIATQLNPALSHGIDRLRAALMESYRYSDTETVHLLINTISGTEIIYLELTNDEIFVHDM
ncbi:hypothetical protein [Paenibacillus sp. FSL E2-0201]|uniref:hypothetical protein n=1 Tax=Paenibacillus sp. FSL E2-0201 TaxID=2954726 RepID=UPI0030DB37F4